MREDFFTPPQGERDGGKGGRRARRKTERKVKKLLRTEGRAERGKGWRGRVEEGGGGSAYAVRNADPFPRWPLWTISLPTAGPKNHNAPRLPPPAFAGLAPRIHNVSGDRNPLDCFNSYYQIDEAVVFV